MCRFIGVLIIVLCVATTAFADAQRGFIGDTGSGWDASGTISARSSYSHPVQNPTKTINGAGISGDGLTHGNGSDDNWFSYSMIPDPDAAYNDGPEYWGKSRYTGAWGGGGFGEGPGNSFHWIEYDLGSVVELATMDLWQYAQGDTGGWAWSCFGLQSFQIHATSVTGTQGTMVGWGSEYVADWTLIYDTDVNGEIAPYGPGDPRTKSATIDFGGMDVQYVVITAIPDVVGGKSSFHDLNWSEEKRGTWSDGVGVGEVRFYEVPEPATMMLLGLGGLALLKRRK